MKKSCVWLLAAAVCLSACDLKKGRTETGARAPDFSGLVEVNAVEAVFDPESRSHCIRLEVAEGKLAGTVVPVYVGRREADVLGLKLARQQYNRPLTHDLLLDLVAASGSQIRHVVVDDLREGVFLARVYLADKGGALHAVDSRASDAIILGVSTGNKLYFSRRVIEESGVKPEPPAGGAWDL